MGQVGTIRAGWAVFGKLFNIYLKCFIFQRLD
jgi:hypothetical protein